MITSSAFDYSDAYIHLKGDAGAAVNNANKKVIFKNCASFTDCTSKINNKQIDNTQNIEVGMAIHHLINIVIFIQKY